MNRERVIMVLGYMFVYIVFVLLVGGIMLGFVGIDLVLFVIFGFFKVIGGSVEVV